MGVLQQFGTQAFRRGRLLALVALILVGGTISMSASVAQADSSLAAPTGCDVVINGLDVAIAIDDARNNGDRWALRAVASNGDYFFLGRTASLNNSFSNELPEGDYVFSARAIIGTERSDWISCGTGQIQATTLAGPQECSVDVDALESITVRISDVRTNVNRYAIRAIERDTNEYVFLGRVNDRNPVFEDPYDLGTWGISVRALSGGLRSEWTFCGNFAFPEAPETTTTSVGCEATLQFGGEEIVARGFVSSTGELPKLLAWSAVNVDTDEYVYFGRFTLSESEFRSFDATLLGVGTWTVQARFVARDGERGEQVACDTFTRTEDVPVLFTCKTRPDFVDLSDYNGWRLHRFEIILQGDDFEMIPQDRTLLFAATTAFIDLKDYSIGETVDVFARPAPGQDGVPTIEPQFCGTVTKLA